LAVDDELHPLGVYRVSPTLVDPAAMDSDPLAHNCGIIDVGRIAALRQDTAYARGIRNFLDFAGVFAAMAQGGEKSVLSAKES